jgi:hypothetical protein
MNSQAFHYSARRQALAEKHRQSVETPERMPGGRLHGRCTICLVVHRSPDMRYGCPDCPGVFCVAEASAQRFACPQCGTRLEGAEEGAGT